MNLIIVLVLNSQIGLFDPTCDLSYCNNNGICYLIDNAATCLCNTGYSGNNCELIPEFSSVLYFKLGIIFLKL